MSSRELVCYWPCERHRGVPLRMLVGAAPAVRTVCPVCDPPGLGEAALAPAHVAEARMGGRRAEAPLTDDRLDGLRQSPRQADVADVEDLVSEVDRLRSRDAALARAEAVARSAPPGSWMDGWGACKVCGGEIPHGHRLDCDYFKLEQELARQRAKGGVSGEAAP